jgi:hypothetical protein
MNEDMISVSDRTKEGLLAPEGSHQVTWEDTYPDPATSQTLFAWGGDFDSLNASIRGFEAQGFRVSGLVSSVQDDSVFFVEMRKIGQILEDTNETC